MYALKTYIENIHMHALKTYIENIYIYALRYKMKQKHIHVCVRTDTSKTYTYIFKHHFAWLVMAY